MSRNGKQDAYPPQKNRMNNSYPREEDITDADYHEIGIKQAQSSPKRHNDNTFRKIIVILSVWGRNLLRQLRQIEWRKHIRQVATAIAFILKKIPEYFMLLLSLIHESIAPQYRTGAYIITALMIMATPLGFMLLFPAANNSANSNKGYDLPISQQGSQTQLNSSLAPFFSPTVQYWANDIEHWSQTSGFDANYLATIIQLESCGNPIYMQNQRLGLFAVSASDFSANEAFNDADTNARHALARLEDGLNRTNANLDMALAYFQGGDTALNSDFTTWPQDLRDIFIFGRRIYRDAQAGLVQSDTFNQWYAASGAVLCQEASMMQDMTMNG